jgi:hypothetical protein
MGRQWARMDKFRAGVFLDAQTHLLLCIGYFLKEPGSELFKWYDLSGYREVKGIKLPSVLVEDDRVKKEVRYEINPASDPQAFERPPSVKDGPEQWRTKRAVISDSLDFSLFITLPVPQSKNSLNLQ